MTNHIQEVYDLGMEKFAGDAKQAKQFTIGFLKEAFLSPVATKAIGEGALKAIGGGIAGIGLALGAHGISSAMNASATSMLRSNYEKALSSVLQTNPLLEDADHSKVRAYADTIFKFAPHVAGDHNLLSTVLAHIVQGEGVDTTIMKTLVELEKQIIESRKGSMFTPKNYF